ncbi:hypothetical protein CONPUDRAFT_61979 [Coniophora puteana RWD-64-598 SS2]|uniref:Uncharacterized protein n=1 Tax=Coniophora puteana (strain RWD-64-598) TaxID=741705 RepID=A0A5M3MG40_CONPW|nr:uncharacterized protein CONPUDRAFT_61979 [Coniophora puteana RWD-64-598 SS2]EIW77724.1 hypothetical protein CONPUDRAFT_61979 [Coniophora puteana RWD-64-598 SS2]
MANLIYRLGGEQLSVALNRRLGLPSRRTLIRNGTFININATIGAIQQSDFITNIRNAILSASTTPAFSGHTVCIDEIALQEKADFDSKSQRVVGICHQHADAVNLTIRDAESAIRIAESLSGEECHLGKEATVIAITTWGNDSIHPVLAAASCKSETPAQIAAIIKDAIRSWSDSGAKHKLGPIWSVATDGDATRRRGFHDEFLKHKINELAEISQLSIPFGDVRLLPGLNCFVGDECVTLDFDPKHIFKRKFFYFTFIMHCL